MPIADYNENTFVAFTDISGFKELMKTDKEALKALKLFYQSGYNVLAESPNIQGLFVSDAGVLFARDGDIETRLSDLLSVVKKINRIMLEGEYMLTTSITYGYFNYQGKIEFEGIEKNPIYGGAYVHAFLDNETGSPKIQPGQCRICKQNLPDLNLDQFEFVKDNGKKHYQFYWNVNSQNEIAEFERKYKDTYSLKYAGMLKALKNNE
jgi:hypothetical protein